MFLKRVGPALWLSVLLGAVMFSALCVGRYGISPLQAVEVLIQWIKGAPIDPVLERVVIGIRLPRVLTAAACGAALALSGACLQSVFRNPLVSPKIIGVSSGAAFGGALAIFLGWGTLGLYGTSFFFGMLTLFCVFLFSAKLRQSLLILILLGVILSGVYSALVSLLQYLADADDTLPSIVFWLMGSFATASFSKLAVFVIPFFITSGLLLALRWRINLLSLNDKNAISLGIAVQPLRWTVLTCCGVLISTQVAVSGSIGWVGLVVPHITRFIFGPDHQRLLPASALLGALILTVIDTCARTLAEAEIPISILTALLGAPVFGWVLYVLKTRGWNE